MHRLTVTPDFLPADVNFFFSVSYRLGALPNSFAVFRFGAGDFALKGCVAVSTFYFTAPRVTVRISSFFA